VVPVAVAGTERIQPIGARLPRIRRVRIRFGPPLRFSRPATPPPPPTGTKAVLPLPAGRLRREITDEIMAAIGALSDQELAGCYAPATPEEQ
jgi:1-acyl-sn-glycerol-3-phosphate acyltransferase